MGLFDRISPEELLVAEEKKARGKALKKGFNIENALYVIEAFYPKNDKETVNWNMPLVAIFQDKVVQSRKSFLGSSLEVIPMKNISSVEIGPGFTRTVNVYTSGNTLTFRTISLSGPKFVEVLRSCIDSRVDSKSSAQLSEVEQLEKLATLLEKGHLTQSEFDKKKAQILGI